MKPTALFPFVSALLILQMTAATVRADELFPGGSFESPKVEGRTPKAKGGDPSNGGNGPVWVGFDHKADDAGGKLVAGLTNEIARTGKQSLFIEFDNLDAKYKFATMQSAPIPIAPSGVYRVSIWGRLDAANPLKPAGQFVTVKVQIDFFKADKQTPLFTENKWGEFWTEATAPAEAAFMVVTWRWQSGGDSGSINGVIYFDDASVRGPAAPEAVAASAPDATLDAK
jgi:hypothetical protein